jgi:hypothetical protein
VTLYKCNQNCVSFLRYMFFTKWGASSPMLERTTLDGLNRTTLVQQKIVYPYGVTADYPTQHVYWVDTYLDFVERIDYDGSNRRTIRKGFPVSFRKHYHSSRRLSDYFLFRKCRKRNCLFHIHDLWFWLVTCICLVLFESWRWICQAF